MELKKCIRMKIIVSFFGYKSSSFHSPMTERIPVCNLVYFTVYLPLAGSDDDSPSRRGKSKRGSKKEDDESWSPRAKVGPVGKRELKSNRVNAKREAVGKGLKNASEMLESVSTCIRFNQLCSN
jgi:hypothetical protein